jgi:hypothetical protein
LYEGSEQMWNDVHEIWDKGVDNDGLVIGSSLETMLKKSENWEQLSAQQKEDWAKELISSVEAAVSWENLNAALGAGENNSIISAINSIAGQIVGAIKSIGGIDVGKNYKATITGADGTKFWAYGTTKEEAE